MRQAAVGQQQTLCLHDFGETERLHYVILQMSSQPLTPSIVQPRTMKIFVDAQKQ